MLFLYNVFLHVLLIFLLPVVNDINALHIVGTVTPAIVQVMNFLERAAQQAAAAALRAPSAPAPLKAVAEEAWWSSSCMEQLANWWVLCG